MILRQPITQKTGVALLIYLLSVSVLELLAYRQSGIFSVLAAWIWALTGLLCFSAFLLFAGSRVFRDIREKRYVLLTGCILLFSLFLSAIGNLSVSDISYEAALQTASGLSSFETPDLNYTGVAFLDYANRQYVINALPSLLFGRGIASLHFGFALPFLIGMTAWFLELRCRLKELGIREEYALLPLFALPTFSFIPEYFMNFEQTLNPVSYTMMGLALLLRFYRKRDVIGILSLSFVGGMCCNSYTPVLAFFGFLVFFLAFWGIKNRSGINSAPWELLACFGLFTQLIAYFSATLTTPQKAMISTVREEIPFLKAVFTSWFDFFFDRHVSFFGIWLGVILVYLFFSCFGQFKLYHFFVAGWMLLTVFFSSYLTGYETYAKAHEIQRNMLMLPVFITALFLGVVHFYVRRFKKSPLRGNKVLFPMTLAFFLLLGGLHFLQPHHSFLYFGYVQPIKYLFPYAEDILREHHLSDTAEFNLIFLTDNRLQSNLSDYCDYFYPNAHTYVADTKEVPVVTDATLPTFLFSESPVPPSDSFVLSGAQTKENLRYRTEYTLYYMEEKKSSGY